MISFDYAYQLTIDRIQKLDEEVVPLLESVSRVTSRVLLSKVNSPTADVSLKDGYAVQSDDISQASRDNPVSLRLKGFIPAGGTWSGSIGQGEAVQILSGARVPPGASAVLAVEFTRQDGNTIIAVAHADKGRNILPGGTDIRAGQALTQEQECLYPMKVGLLASSGIVDVPVVQQPRVAVIATGDEVVAPGTPLLDGKLYASNLVTLAGWCIRYGFKPQTFVVPDNRQKIQQALEIALNNYDIVLTSGGAWKSERDLVVHILEEMGWEKVYHRVKLGPGKAVGFGFCQEKPVFLLPGGPPSNHMAFLQLALPAIKKMAGWIHIDFPQRYAVLAEEMRGQIDWTQFVHGTLNEGSAGEIFFKPSLQSSRLQMLAASDAVAKIPEGVGYFPKGALIPVQDLR